MSDHLKKTLEQIGEDFRQAISEDSRHYCEVSIGRKAEHLGYTDLKQQFQDVYAIVPTAARSSTTLNSTAVWWCRSISLGGRACPASPTGRRTA